MCSQTGGHLASLHTPEERLFVGQLMRTHTPVWLGGRRAQQVLTHSTEQHHVVQARDPSVLCFTNIVLLCVLVLLPEERLLGLD